MYYFQFVGNTLEKAIVKRKNRQQRETGTEAVKRPEEEEGDKSVTITEVPGHSTLNVQSIGNAMGKINGVTGKATAKTTLESPTASSGGGGGAAHQVQY